MSTQNRLKKIAKLSNLKEGKSLSCDILDGLSIAIILKDGKVYAINNSCPHKMAPLSEGHLENHAIVCPWHCWKFDITNGNCVSGQEAKLKTYEVIIKEDDIFIAL
jgi:nitrite reductase/ring-hydroxylating ferredoxin subunit